MVVERKTKIVTKVEVNAEINRAKTTITREENRKGSENLK